MNGIGWKPSHGKCDFGPAALLVDDSHAGHFVVWATPKFVSPFPDSVLNNARPNSNCEDLPC